MRHFDLSLAGTVKPNIDKLPPSTKTVRVLRADWRTDETGSHGRERSETVSADIHTQRWVKNKLRHATQKLVTKEGSTTTKNTWKYSSIVSNQFLLGANVICEGNHTSDSS